MEPGKNINKLLKSFNIGSTSGSGFSMPSLGNTSGFRSKLLFIGSFILALLIVIILIHFLVTPVFKTKMGSTGIIPLPLQTEGSQYWIKEPTLLPVAGTPLESKLTGYTASVDILLERPSVVTNKHRLIAVRKNGVSLGTGGDNKTIQQELGNFNFVIYFDQTKNDVHVAVLNEQNSIKEVVIKNAPVREPFRLVLVIADSYFDVYMNGRLAGTNTYTGILNSSSNNIIGPDDTSVKVKNLILFNRALTPAEARDIRPGIAKFDMGAISDSNTCSTFTESFVPEVYSNN